MITKKRIIFFVSVCVLLISVYFFTPHAISYFRWQIAAKAVSSLPYQIGLTNANIIKCFPSCCAPVCACCAGGTLCMTKDPATCLMYSDISGTPAGGMGSNALFLNTAMAQAGLSPGGQLIAGGMSPVLMDSGVLASSGGCYGCYAKAGTVDKIINWVDRYFIVGFKD